jgi:hypothetical protein
MLQHVPVAAEVVGDEVKSVTLQSEDGFATIRAKIFLDATETGELLALTGTEYVLGSEARSQTGEEHAGHEYRPDNLQGLTWCFAMANDPGSHRVLDKPSRYDWWRSFQPPFWPGPLIGEVDLDPITLLQRRLPFVSQDPYTWFTYRQVRQASDNEHAVTIVNWPMNDYFLAPVVDVPAQERASRLQASKELGLCLLYWLQTEMNLSGLYLRPDITDTIDGFAKAPYHRESRRIVARQTITEQMVSAGEHPGRGSAPPVQGSVGIGAYRIDLHPSTGGDSYIDLSSLPFQIPLGALIPVRMRNLLPACKNIGTTHITNGCYRLHPVEWNIGEASGGLAAFCCASGLVPAQVLESESLTARFQERLLEHGFELEWPELGPL